MRTSDSERFAHGLFRSLLKAWEEEEHPRDEQGRFAVSEARRVAELLLPSSDQPRHPQKAVRANVETMRAASSSDYPRHVKREGYLGGGAEESWHIEFKDGSKVVYKPKKGTYIQQRFIDTKPEIDEYPFDPAIAQADREIAAYKLSRAAGFDIVPPVEKVTYSPSEIPPGQVKHVASPGGGHAMAWVDGEDADKGGEKYTTDLADGHPDLHRIAALDFITGIVDRHEGNFMRGTDGRYYAVDNGLSFCRDQEVGYFCSAPLRDLKYAEIPRDVRDEIKSISNETLVRIMKEAGFADPDVLGALSRLEVVKTTARWGSANQMLAAAEDVYFQAGGRRRAEHVE